MNAMDIRTKNGALMHPIGIPGDRPCRILITGSSGSGKTNMVFNLIKLHRKRKVRIKVWEYKPEMRRLIGVWEDAIIFTPKNAPWQFLKPIGPDPLAFYIGILGELRLEFELRPET